jgi:YfiH family protein
MSPSPPALSRKNNRLIFPGFSSPSLFHGSFTRQGGVSPAPYDSLNVAYGLDDDEANVQENRDRIKTSLSIPKLVSCRQVHGDRVAVIVEKPATDLAVDGHDALITAMTGIGLMIQHADCQAILLHDPVKRVVGIIHAGWRGSVANIARKTVAAMQKSYGCDPADLRAAISPSLGPCCAEFRNYQLELPAEFYRYQVRPYYFDFWAISRDQLHRAGIRTGNIAVANQCTVCNSDYFSFRRDRVTGRCATVIGIRE